MQACSKQKNLKQDVALRANSVDALKPNSSKILVSVSFDYKCVKVEQIV